MSGVWMMRGVTAACRVWTAVSPARPLDHLLHLATLFTRSNKCLGCCQAGKTYTIVASAERPGMQVCIRACAKTFNNS